MSLVYKDADDTPKFRIGLNGNYYVYSKLKKSVDDIANQIGKAESSVYFSVTHKVWTIRVKLKAHKEELRKIFMEG